MPNLAGLADFLTPLAAAMKEYRNRNSPQWAGAESRTGIGTGTTG